jgi:hypothetical protein
MFGIHTPKAEKVRGFTMCDAAMPGTHWTFEFPNGYGASVINDGYGREQGLHELAVMRGTHIDYDTPITDDVLGCLSIAEVVATLDAIAALPAVTA